MASFYGNTFQFDNQSSEVYGLRIVNFDNGVSDGDGGSEPQIFSKWMINRTKNYFYGIAKNIPLKITMTLAAENPIDAEQRGLISKWLLARHDYLPLIIDQDDMLSIQYDCLFTKLVPKFIGNECRAITISGECSSPFGYQYQQILTKNYSGSAVVNETFNYLVQSDDDGYIYPDISFKTSSTSGGSSCWIALTNNTDASRVFSFTGISGSETITVSNDLGIISSSTGLLRMSKFNKNFFRVISGNNIINISGSLVNFTMTSKAPKKAGA